MENTWGTRDLPVLQAVVDIYEETGHAIRPKAIETKTGFEADTVQKALRALRSEEPPFFTNVTAAMGGIVVVIGAPTGHARRQAGAWPTPEALAQRLIEQLNDAADGSGDEEQRGALKKTAKFLAEGGRDILVGIATATLTG